MRKRVWFIHARFLFPENESLPEEGEVTKELSYTEKVVTFVPDTSFLTHGGHLSANCRTFVDRERARATAIVRVKTVKK